MSLVPTGMPLLHAIQILKIKLHFVKNISVNFCQKRPLESNIEVDLKEQGILLKFDHRTQRLKVCVCVCECGHMCVRHMAVLLNGICSQCVSALYCCVFGCICSLSGSLWPNSIPVHNLL